MNEMLALYKGFAISSLFISVFAIYYVFDRKVYRISKSIFFITGFSFMISLLELLKYETMQSLSLEKMQTYLLLYIPALVYSFFSDFLSSDVYKESRTLNFSLYLITTVYLILALTNNLHNLFWTGTLTNRYYLGKLRPHDGIIGYTYYVFLFIVMSFIAIRLMKTEKILFKTKYKITLVFALAAVINVVGFTLSLNYTIMSFTLSSSILVIELLAVKFIWRKISLGLRFRFLEQSKDGYIVIDNDGYVIDINQEGLSFLGDIHDNVIGRKNKFIDSLVETTESENQIIEHSGKYFLCTSVKFDDGTVLSIRNISSEILAEKQRENLSVLLNALFQNIPDGVAILKEDGTVVDCNTNFVNMFGYSKEEIEGKSVDDFVVPDSLLEESRKLRELAISQKTLKTNTVAKKKDGKLIDVRLTMAKIENFGEGLMYAIYTDISSEKEIVKYVKSSLEKDILTGLYNRFYFIRKLTSVTEFSSTDEHHAVIFIDIRDFSTINSSKGHSFGDEVLREISKRLKNTLREGDTIARVYADEFWILVEKVGNSYSSAKQRVQNILSKMLRELSKPYTINEETFEIGFYVAVHIFSVLDKVEEVLRKGNLSLEKAKTSEEGIVFYNIIMDNELQERVTKERDFREAFYEGNVKIFLQPICNYTGKIVGAEALLRWIDKNGRIILPSEFIHYLEENGMIVLVGEEVLRQVCEVLRKVKDKLPFVDVNISPVQLRIQNMADRFSEIILSNGVNPSQIVLEITENILIDVNQTVRNNIDRLLKLGCQICIDDFGTGYSSLSYLTLFPLNKLKIDRSFIAKLPDDKHSLKLLEAIFDISKSFEIDAIPEGVENTKQLEVLSMIGYKFFQGYYFAKPMPVDDFIDQLMEKWA
ncbi:MAG TPA: EAL domain-containing protein [Fervidobacterium sp.]|nr:EAL domain-containing protein [Fervidobacterium sp.]HPT53456.1 EAL domain-containing protein [Fervidobacterium sp.]